MGSGIYWTRELSVGVERIDQQHRELFNQVNHFLEAYLHDRESAEVRTMLDYLHAYADRHFSEEEHLMAARHYQALPAHHRQHVNFCRKLDLLDQKLSQPTTGTNLLEDLVEMIIDWLYEHICMEDRILGRFLNQTSTAT